ncbi:MAG: aspartate kinase [Bacteroidetes bacterium]|jgi:aspartate kinase|nr:aspartate kinase [Bacteroidota bacterium]
MLLVLKFGGTSVGSAQRIKDLVKLTVSPTPKIVVLSAMSGTTNALVEISNALYSKDVEKANSLISALKQKYLKEISELYSKKESLEKATQLVNNHFNYITAFTLDMFTVNEEKAILAQGELLSTAMFHYYLEETGVKSVLLPALNFMRIDPNDEPDLTYIEKNCKEELKKYPGDNLFITQGYICRNAFGEIDNLKRGGSDYTASLIGAAIQSPEVQIWTDIDGMHNNDPRVVSKTHPINQLSFDEAAELAYFGAKILHPTCILPAQKRNVPVRLKNTMQPEAEGTIIANISTNEGIKAVAAKDGIIALNIKSERMLLAHGFLRAVFEVFERHKTSIDMITTSEVAVSVTIDNTKYLNEITKELREIAIVEVDTDQTIICVVGQIPKDRAGYGHKVMEALKDIPLRMVSYGGSSNNISVLVKSSFKKEALQALNKGLFNYNN